MAKKNKKHKSDNAVVRATESNGFAVNIAETVGEGLGHVLNQIEDQWSTARTQRDHLVSNLRAIRDKANQLLVEAGDAMHLPGTGKRRKGARKARKTSGSAVPPAVARVARRTSTKAAEGRSAKDLAKRVDTPRARLAALKAAKKSGQR